MISINFASRNYRLISRVRTGLVAGCVVLAFMTAGMLWKAFSLRAAIAAVEQAVKERGADEEQARSLIAERGQLVKDLSAMSGLTESRKFSWTRLLTSIEAAVPAGAALKSVDFNPGDRTLTLEGAARSPGGASQSDRRSGEISVVQGPVSQTSIARKRDYFIQCGCRLS